ncbi:GmrSD restriction endonuclease domain-containing protein, partial [Thiolapillus sp.]|uniref:GmrSD restriction endonuclease domain-containing protein n=1 Tax=Thiolapillus sp. TaxID=2017437 RepID=UPI003AF6BF32
YRRFPKDDEFKRELKIKDLYNFRSRSYWLRRLENHGRKERVPVDEYTIEHILPQCDNDPEKVPTVWRDGPRRSDSAISAFPVQAARLAASS